MTIRMTRRALLKASAAATSLPVWPALAQERRFEPKVEGWRTFEVTTAVEVADTRSACKVWLPVPDINSDYQQSLDSTWSGNANAAKLTVDGGSGVRMLYAEFADNVGTPNVSLTSRVRTRNRAVDWSRSNAPAEDPALLRANLQPTDLIPTDGIVLKTAQEATQGASTDFDKVRGIYDWLVTHAHREPTVRGCGIGDIKAMLETGNLGGKCADLNAIFVGMCRSLGIPARDIYGLRLAPSGFGYRELGANPANLKGAQHCRAEAYLRGHGWVAMDPADVLKVMRQETPDWIKDIKNPVAAPVSKGLFGGWEGNWVGWNTGHDVALPGSASKVKLPFLMYPNGENAKGRFDELAPDNFRYAISSREISA